MLTFTLVQHVNNYLGSFQLLLTSSSDGRVVLSSMTSISSESQGHLDEDEEGETAPLEDGVIQVLPI